MANVSFRTDDETKKAQAAELFRDLGLDMSTAIKYVFEAVDCQ